MKVETDIITSIIYTITNWRVSLSKICHSWPNKAITHEWHSWVTALFGHDWHIFDNGTCQLVIVFIILIKKMFRSEFNIKGV
jgi:hypothetical protein